MKRWLAVGLWVAVACMVAPAAFAQDAPKTDGENKAEGDKPAAPAQPGDRTRGQRGQRGQFQRGQFHRGQGQNGPGGQFNRGRLQDLVAKLDLTEDQKTKVNDIFKAAEDARAADREKNAEKMKELRTQIDEATKANDQAKVTQLRDEMRKLFGDPAAAQQDLLTKVKAVLTAEQSTKLDQLLAEQQRSRSRLLADVVLRNGEQLKLTDEQKKQIEDLVKAYRDAVTKISGDDKDKQTRELTDKLSTDVKSLLTDEQKTAVDKLQADRGGRGGDRAPGDRVRGQGGDRVGGQGGDRANRGPRNGGGRRGNRGGAPTPAPGGDAPKTGPAI